MTICSPLSSVFSSESYDKPAFCHCKAIAVKGIADVPVICLSHTIVAIALKPWYTVSDTTALHFENNIKKTLRRYKMKMQISVFGAEENASDRQKGEAHLIGYHVSKNCGMLITGACNGLSHDAARGAHEHGGSVIGISPSKNMREHGNEGYPFYPFFALIFTDTSAWRRNIVILQSCDAAILLDEGAPTISKFSFAYKETPHNGFVVGILAKNGSDTAAKLAGKTGIRPNAIIVKDNPDSLVTGVINEILRQHKAPRQKPINMPNDRKEKAVWMKMK